MFPPIVCFCGRSIADICDLFKALKAEKLASIGGRDNILPEMLAFTEEANVEMGDILDALHLNLECCRSRLLGLVEYKNVYNIS